MIPEAAHPRPAAGTGRPRADENRKPISGLEPRSVSNYRQDAEALTAGEFEDLAAQGALARPRR